MLEKNRGSIPGWPGWETVRLIGRGSFGAVYEIKRDVFGDLEKCALKHISVPQADGEIREMLSEGLDEESITQSFSEQAKDIVKEYKMMSRLNDCPNVVTCHDVNFIQKDSGYGWDIYIRMELLTPFMDLLSQRKDWPEEEIIHLGIDISTALTACRALNIIHRDIKPQNIFVAKDGRYKLGDFGIARVAEKTSSATARIGTYTYMAPEVYYGEHYGAAADIYSLGMVLYWLLNERRAPFVSVNTAREKDAAQRRRMSGETIPAPAYGSEALKRIVLKACAYEAKDRFQTAEDMLWALKGIGKTPAPRPAGEVLSSTPSEASTFIPEHMENDDDATSGSFLWKRPREAEKAAAPLEREGEMIAARKRPETTSADAVPSAVQETDDTVGVFFHRKGSEITTAFPGGGEPDFTVSIGHSISRPAGNNDTADKPVEVFEEAGPDEPATEFQCGALTCRYSDKTRTLTFSGSGKIEDYSFYLMDKRPWGMYSPEHIVINSGVSAIGENAFRGFGEVTTVTIPDTVTKIGDHAFSNCSNLKSIDIPNSVTSIGIGAFLSCSSLSSVKLPVGITVIERSLFMKCGNLKEITIPQNVKTISSYAFSDCNQLMSVSLHYVPNIMVNAFEECKNLKDVYFSGSKTEWAVLKAKTNISNRWLLMANLHYDNEE